MIITLNNDLQIEILEYSSDHSSKDLECLNLINSTRRVLEERNTSVNCSVLNISMCDSLHNKLKHLALPISVHTRASKCDWLDITNTQEFNKEEVDYPLAFSILTYG